MTITMKSAQGCGRWDEVRVGDTVHLTSSRGTEFAGEVDDLTTEGDIVWVHNPVGGRRLFEINDGFELRLG